MKFFSADWIKDTLFGAKNDPYSEEKVRARRNTQLLKEFDVEWELLFNEEGPFYDKQGTPKTGTTYGEVIPHILRMVTELARRSRA